MVWLALSIGFVAGVIAGVAGITVLALRNDRNRQR